MALSLKELTGNRYDITFDPAWLLEQSKFKQGAQHWYERITCKNGGSIYLYSEAKKLFIIATKKPTGNKILQEINEAKLRLETHDELEILFPIEVIHQVAQLAGAKRKRGRKQLPAEERQKLVEAGKAFRFSGKITGKKRQKPPQIPSLFQ